MINKGDKKTIREKKTGAETDGNVKKVFDDQKSNLGLDADGSSEQALGAGKWNNDNDRVSGNPDGEDDLNDTNERPGHSPLMDK